MQPNKCNLELAYCINYQVDNKLHVVVVNLGTYCCFKFPTSETLGRLVRVRDYGIIWVDRWKLRQ